MASFKEKLRQQKLLQKTTATKRDFNYSKDGVNLGFTLNIDSDKELNNFRECLVEAIKDIDTTLKIYE